MKKELKKQIIDWLFLNENEWQRLNACAEKFRDYIYNSEGNYLIGGTDVYNFIKEMDKIIYN